MEKLPGKYSVFLASTRKPMLRICSSGNHRKSSFCFCVEILSLPPRNGVKSKELTEGSNSGLNWDYEWRQQLFNSSLPPHRSPVTATWGWRSLPLLCSHLRSDFCTERQGRVERALENGEPIYSHHGRPVLLGLLQPFSSSGPIFENLYVFLL